MRRTFAFLVPALLWGTPWLGAQALPTPLAVEPSVREESRQFFRTIYARSEGVPLEWSGGAPNGGAGDTAAAFKEAVRLRINYFRAMAGVPAAVTLDAALSAKAQQAALMIGVNRQVSATPPASWIAYTAGGAEAAANSNLLLGKTGAEAITAQIGGAGDTPAALDPRRWLLYPWTKVMGTGDVPAANSRRAANATWVRDTANFSGPRPATRDAFVAWPPRGYVPYAVVFPRWSCAYPGADFSAATVTMTRGETNVPVRLETVTSGAGESTLGWIYDNLDARLATAHPRPAVDTPYTVTITGVRGVGVPAGFSYVVTVFDPEIADRDVRPPTVNGSITPAVGQANPYNFFRPALATGMEWRRIQVTPSTPVFGAEGGLQGILATTTGTYAARDTAQPGSGAAAYRLRHETAEPQILLLPGAYYSPLGAPGTLSFRSLLGAATAVEVARVQVSLDDGGSWREVFAQAGSGGVGETAYRTHTLSLETYAGRTMRVRFVYSTEEEVSPAGAGAVGWYLDDITLIGTRAVATVEGGIVADGSVFRFTPGSPGEAGLQARGLLAGGVPMEWGPVAAVVAVGANGAGDPGRLTNLAIRTQAGTGDQTLIMGLAIGGTGTFGNKVLLIRGVGPSLGAFGVAGVLADPILDVRSGTLVLATNDNWDGNPQVAATTTQVGAFPLATAASRDAALVTTRGAGPYTVQISGTGGTTGIALAEVYDAPPIGGFTPSTPRLANVSARAQIGTGGEILIAGFTIGGSTEKTLLIRAIGPALGAFGVDGFITDPKLELYSSSGTLLTSNDNWLATDSLTNASVSVGAFALPPGSRDAALLITMLPGSYTAQVSGVSGGTGVGLVEVYEVP